MDKIAAPEPNARPSNETGLALSHEAAKLGIAQSMSATRAQDAVPPTGTAIGPTAANENIIVTVIVKSKASDQDMDQAIKDISDGKRAPLSKQQFAAEFSADPDALKRVTDTARADGLAVVKSDAVSGQLQLEGTAADISQAFNVKLQDYRDGTQTFRYATPGNGFTPHVSNNDIEGVLGLDTRPQAKPQLLPRDDQPAPDGEIHEYMPNQVADLYHFPKESMGAGQSVGIIEMGGGLDLRDNAQYYTDHQLKTPEIRMVALDGAKTDVGDRADIEVALDSQIVGVVAPDAKQQLVFVPNTEQGLVDAITRSTFPEKGEIQNSVLSISWGNAEKNWSKDGVHNIDLALKKAVLQGISVFASSGDFGATNRAKDNSYSVVFPASDPYVTGTGGTRLEPSGSEVAWNDSMPFFGISATGGGISNLFEVPEFQKNVTLPPDANSNGHIGRGVPDVAADSSVSTGYTIRVGGKQMREAGTSAAAPLYSALMLRVNGALGHPVGYLNPFLYKNGSSSMFKDITSGDNEAYAAGPGWDATTGWGSIRGDKFLDLLRQEEQAKK